MIRKRSSLMTTIAQIRGARGLLGWSQPELAKAAGLSEPTVKRFETANGAKVSDAAVGKMVAALETAGVIFVAENGEGAGVRLRKQFQPGDYAKAAAHGPTRVEDVGRDTDGVIRATIVTRTKGK